MAYIVSQISKYIMTVAFLLYTFESFWCLKLKKEHERTGIYVRQNVLMCMIHLLGFFTLFVNDPDSKYIVYFVLQEAVVLTVIFLYKRVYPNACMALVNNMCMLLLIGLIIISRISFEKAQRQFFIMTGALIVTMFIPYALNKFRHPEKLKWIYVFGGIVSLLAVLVFSSAVNGSKINITLFSYTFQPSEYVKIIFTFAVACLLYEKPDLKKIIISAVIAATHVLLLVASKDLGSAIIYFVVYFTMLYAATKDIRYYLAGLALGALSAVAGYKMFAHVRVRVTAYTDPFGTIDNAGYQIAQSLFAIGTGSWFGMGLCQGAPGTIPVVTADFIFSAIVEEMGIIFGICLILVCVSCIVIFMDLAQKIDNMFYRLTAVGLTTYYGFQVFLTVGGVTKFIPLTGVTLPLVSYGGTSIAVTLVLFAIIQGMYISQNNADEDLYQPVFEDQLNNKLQPDMDEEDISFNMAVEEGLRLAADDPDDYSLDEFKEFYDNEKKQNGKKRR